MSRRKSVDETVLASNATGQPDQNQEPTSNGRKKPDRSNAPFAGIFANGPDGKLKLVRTERTIGKARKYADMVLQMLNDVYGPGNWFVASIKRRDATYIPRTRKPKESSPAV